MYDLIIIGGGPAAASAAFYANEKQLAALVVYDELGGKVGQRESLISYDCGDGASATRRYVRRGDQAVADLVPPLPANGMVRSLIGHAMHKGCTRRDRVLHIRHNADYFSVETEQNGVLSCQAVIVATGTTPRRLEALGADQLVDHGMDYSITTYAQHTRGQHVAVIGGTERALLGAAELSQVAEHVTVIIPDRHFKQTPLYHALRQQHNISFVTGYDVTEAIGDRAIEALVLRSGLDTRLIPVQRAFVALGLRPNSDLVQHFGCTDANGLIIVDSDMATATPGLFAAGDVTTAGGEQVLISVGDGARAAKSAHTFVLTRALERQRQHERECAAGS